MSARRALPWVLVGLGVLVLVAIIAALVQPAPEPPAALSASSAAPSGGMAVAEVLRDQGVDVIETDSLADTEHAAARRDDTTILLVDNDLVLDARQHARLLALAQHVVAVEPYDTALGELAPGVVPAGYLNGDYPADCDLPAAQKAGRAGGEASAYRLAAGEDGTACFTVGGDLSALVEVDTIGTRVTVLGVGSALRNDQVAAVGNAALALNLLGETRTLIWYLPGPADLFEDSTDTLAELQAPWTVPLVVLLFLIAFAAIAWRWRRFGPLVVENLPVVVRARETMEGRARLYERGSSRAHALDALRVGTVSRLARRCGLSRRATVAEVIDAVAALTGRDRVGVSALLLETEPRNDAELVRLSDELLILESDVDAAARPA